MVIDEDYVRNLNLLEAPTHQFLMAMKMSLGLFQTPRW